jgi:Zn-dependent M16 (insulinase) family peptidase
VQVRVQGGAYGGFCSFDAQSGQFAYLSYRDPNLLQTLDAYDGALPAIRASRSSANAHSEYMGLACTLLEPIAWEAIGDTPASLTLQHFADR